MIDHEGWARLGDKKKVVETCFCAGFECEENGILNEFHVGSLQLLGIGPCSRNEQGVRSDGGKAAHLLYRFQQEF